MFTTFKKLLACILFVSVLLFPISPFYKTQVSGESIPQEATHTFTYTVVDGTAIITGYTGSGGNVEVPSTIDGYSVTQITDGTFTGNFDIQTIYIPASVTEIGSRCFYWVPNLSSISVELENPNYSSLEGVLFNKSHSELLAYPMQRQVKRYEVPDGTEVILSEAFSDNQVLENVVFPASLTTIGNMAFAGCPYINNVVIPASVTSIGYAPFGSSIGLTNLTVDLSNQYYSSLNNVLFDKNQKHLIGYPAGITTSNYIVPTTVTTICRSAFGGARNLISISLPESLTTIENQAFSATGLTSVTIPNSVISIGERPFISCGNLSEINVALGNTRYVSKEGVLFNYSQTELIEYPSSKPTVEYAVPNEVRKIADLAFDACLSLERVNLPVNLNEIGRQAFNNCNNLSSAYFSSNSPIIGSNPFNYPAENFSIYYYSGKFGFQTPYWNGYPSVELEADYSLSLPCMNYSIDRHNIFFANWPEAPSFDCTFSIISSSDTLKYSVTAQISHESVIDIPSKIPIVSGDKFLLTSGYLEREMVVKNISNVKIDYTNDIISGTSDAIGQEIVVKYEEFGGQICLVSEDGIWAADFSGKNGVPIHDIVDGDMGVIRLYDSDTDQISLEWFTPGSVGQSSVGLPTIYAVLETNHMFLAAGKRCVADIEMEMFDESGNIKATETVIFDSTLTSSCDVYLEENVKIKAGDKITITGL